METEPFWTVLWGVKFSSENRSEPFFVHPKVVFSVFIWTIFFNLFSFTDIWYLNHSSYDLKHHCMLNHFASFSTHIILYYFSIISSYHILSPCIASNIFIMTTSNHGALSSTFPRYGNSTVYRHRHRDTNRTEITYHNIPHGVMQCQFASCHKSYRSSHTITSYESYRNISCPNSTSA